MSAKTVGVIIYWCRSKTYGNTSQAFTYTDYVADKTVNATADGVSNVHSMMRHMGIVENAVVHEVKMPCRKFAQLVKGWPYARCRGEDMAAFVRAELAK